MTPGPFTFTAEFFRALGCRLGQPPDDEAGRGGAQGAVDTQAGQQVRTVLPRRSAWTSRWEK